MRNIFIITLLLLICSNASSDQSDKYFHIGKMVSYDKKFTLYFKTRENAILARGEDLNYVTDYPQDFYFYQYQLKIQFLMDYDYPVFPEDFSYYLLEDNNTLVMVSANKNISKNLTFDIQKKELRSNDRSGKLGFIISSYAKNCGYAALDKKHECNLFKPLISKNLIN